jgi:hypothetical protein
MFNLNLGAPSTDKVVPEEAPLCWTPALKCHAHDGNDGYIFPKNENMMNRAIVDAIGAVAFHPLHPLLLSVSGSRHFDDIDSDSGQGSDTGSDSSVLSGEVSRGGTRVSILGHRHRPQPTVRDNSFRLWNFGKLPSCLGKD